MSLSETVEQLNREISATVERALSEMRREISQRLRASSDDISLHLESFTPELPGVFLAQGDLAPAAETARASAIHEGRQDLLGSLRESFAAVDRARTQAEILGALLEACCRFASRAALLLLRGGELRGWDGRGWHEADQAIRDLTLQPAEAAPEATETASPAQGAGHGLDRAGAADAADGAGAGNGAAGAAAPAGAHDDGPWTHLSAGQRGFRLTAADSALLCSRLESPLPQEAVLLPLVLRDRVAAVLYADRLEGGELEVEALQLLTYVAAQAIETLSFRERGATATLADLAAGGTATPASLPPPAESEPPAPIPQAPREPETQPASSSAEPSSAAAAEPHPSAAEPHPTAVASPSSAEGSEPAEPSSGDPAAGGLPAGAGEMDALASLVMPAPYLAPTPAPEPRHEGAADGGRADVSPYPSEGGTELPGSPVDRPAFLDDSLAYSSRHTTELPMPGEETATRAEEPAWMRPSRPTPVPEPPERAPDSGRRETVLLPRPGFRETVPSPWARAAREDKLEAEEKPEPHAPHVPHAPDDPAHAPAEARGEQPGQPEPIAQPVQPALHLDLSDTAQTPRAVHDIGVESTPPVSYDTTLTPVTPFPSAPPAEASEPERGNAVHADAGPGAATAANTLPPSGVYREPTTAGFEPLRTTPLTSGTPEVRPPSGVQGPGWAFATTRLATTSEESAHEEARRLARLLVSEIKLYNEDQVEAGRRNRDIYERLREDIDRSRQMYEERVEPRLVKSTDYFYQELVRILAAGDSKALGI